MFENRIGTTRDKDKMLAAKKLMPESLSNIGFCGTTMSYSELLVALENNVVDKVATVLTVRSRTPDTSAPMEIGMSAKDDGGSAREEGYQSIVDLALQGEEPAKENGVLEKGQNWRDKGYHGGKGGKDGRGESMAKVQRQERRQRCKRKVAREKAEPVGRVEQQDTEQRGVGKEARRIRMPLMRKTANTSKKQRTVKKSCKHGACWKKARTSSGKK